jgi:hypothetical protein
MQAHRNGVPGWMARRVVAREIERGERARLVARLDMYCGPRMCGGCGQRFHAGVLEQVSIGGGTWYLCEGCRALARS